MSSRQSLQILADKMNADASHIQNLDGVLQFDITGDDSSTYQVVFKDGAVALKDDEYTTPACTLQLSGENLDKLIHGKLNPTTAVFMGSLKVKGDLAFAMRIQSILQKYA